MGRGQNIVVDPSSILYGKHSRKRTKIWGPELSVLLARYILPQLRGLQNRNAATQQEQEWMDKRYPPMLELYRKIFASSGYLPSKEDKDLISSLIEWLSRPEAVPMAAWSSLDTLKSMDDLIVHLRLASD